MPLLQTVHCVPSLRQYTPLLPFSFALHIPYYHNYTPLIDSTLRTVTSTLHSRLTSQLRSAHTILCPYHRQYIACRHSTVHSPLTFQLRSAHTILCPYDRQYIAYRHFDTTLPSYLSASLCTYHIMLLSQTIHYVPTLRQYIPHLPFSFALHIPYYAPITDNTLRAVTSTVHSPITFQLRSAHTIIMPHS